MQAKQAMATDESVDISTPLPMVLMKIFEALRPGLPQTWISMAADVSDLMAVRMHFVSDSGKIFNENKLLLEKFVMLRAVYTLTILRDLNRLKRIRLEAGVALIVSTLHSDLQHMIMRLDEKLHARAPGDESKEPKEKNTSSNLPQTHPSALLVPGFDSLQSILIR